MVLNRFAYKGSENVYTGLVKSDMYSGNGWIFQK